MLGNTEVNYTTRRKLATGYCCDINICDWASYVACYHIIVFMSTAFLVCKTAVMSLQLDTLCFTTLGIDITFRTTSQTLHVYEREPTSVTCRSSLPSLPTTWLWLSLNVLVIKIN